jgi:rhodanese-related sulfurtransferase
MEKLVEFASNNMWLVLALMISFFMVIFSELRRKASGMVNVDAVHAVKLINNDAIVIDLRSADAYSRGHIVGARNIPADELEAKIEGLAGMKDKPVVTVCEAGMTSTKAVATLKTAGFESAFGVKGGMAGWKEAGLPIVSGKKTKTKAKKTKNK